MPETRAPINAANSTVRGGVWGGAAAGAVTQDPMTALYVAGITAVVSGLGNWGRTNKDAEGIKGVFANIFASIGGA